MNKIMRYYKEIDNKKVFFDGILKINGKQIINPSEEQILADGWQEYIPPVAEPYKPSYEELVEQYIRERYGVSDELAILRQRDTKADEFNEYYAYCEECKQSARNINLD